MAESDKTRPFLIGAVLSSAATREQRCPEYLELRDAIDELRRWLDDDRQWGQTKGRHWQSLIADVDDSLRQLGDSTQRRLDAPRFSDTLRVCRALFEKEKPPTDLALRRRLSRITTELEALVLDPGALVASWDDLQAVLTDADQARDAAGHFLSIADWVGHSPDLLRQHVERELLGKNAVQIDGKVVKPDIEDARSGEERLDAVRTYLREPAARGRAIVWLQFQLAKVDSEASGFPVIPIGRAICIYQGEWLRSCVLHSQADRDLPPEAVDPDLWELRLFLGLPAYGTKADLPPEPREQPTAYIRVDVGDQVIARAVDIARSNAEALAALGTLYGANPTLWSLDESNIVFIDGYRPGSVAAPASVAEPTFEQRIAVHEDRTAQVLRDMAPKLAPHLPIRDSQLERATTLLGWLRGARSSPPPLRLVLCDRVIESVAGWAGIASPADFVRQNLIPWWAYTQIRSVAVTTAYSLFWDHPHARASNDRDLQAQWQEIMNHEPLAIHRPEATMSLRGLLSETQWLLQRVPADSRLHEHLTMLDHRTRTGQAAAAWWNMLCAQANRAEGRRSRTRNALMHGGPLAPGTVESVVLFADDLAREALAASLEGKLLDENLIDYFLDRQSRLSEMRTRLARGEAPANILFAESR